MPTPLGMAVRAVAYRLILRMNGLAAIERGVRLRYANHITLDHGAYIDQGATCTPARTASGSARAR